MQKRAPGRPRKDLDPLRELLSSAPRSGPGLVRVPMTGLAVRLDWHRETVDAGLRRLAALGEVRIVQRGRGERGSLVMFLDANDRPSRVPIWGPSSRKDRKSVV